MKHCFKIKKSTSTRYVIPVVFQLVLLIWVSKMGNRFERTKPAATEYETVTLIVIIVHRVVYFLLGHPCSQEIRLQIPIKLICQLKK